MFASQRTLLLSLGRELLFPMISQVGSSEKDSIFGIKSPFSFIRLSLPLMGYTVIDYGHRIMGIAVGEDMRAGFEVIVFVF